MPRRDSQLTRVQRLVSDLFDEAADPMAIEVLTWTEASAPFRAFVESHRDKIRKKLRGASDADARLDVRTELRVAALLLAERHLSLAYEAYGTARGGPDFTATFRGERPVNVEVTRVRRDPSVDGIARVLIAKLRQLPPGTPNLLVVCVAGVPATAVDVPAAARLLRDHADRKDDALFARAGHRGTRGFYERFLRLGAVAVLDDAAASPRDGAPERATWWTNSSARIGIPPGTARACLRCLRATW